MTPGLVLLKMRLTASKGNISFQRRTQLLLNCSFFRLSRSVFRITIIILLLLFSYKRFHITVLKVGGDIEEPFRIPFHASVFLVMPFVFDLCSRVSFLYTQLSLYFYIRSASLALKRFLLSFL